MVAIVVDSAANIPPRLARDLSIELVPLYLRFGEAVYRDGVDLTPTDFYGRLLSERVVASTSAPSPGDYLAAFDRTGDGEIVCVSVAGEMSSSFQHAAIAAGRFHGRVEMVDSRSASMGEGFVAIEAARRAVAGGGLEGAAARAREVARRTWLFATVDTFEFLQRSGRVTRLQAYAATALDIKPVFRLHQGDIAPISRARTRRRALARIIEETVARVADRPVHLAVIHASAGEDARRVTEAIQGRVEVVECHVVPVTPVIGAHTGPGLVGTAFFCD